MSLIRIGPTEIDQAVAGHVARKANEPLERVSELLTYSADENVLLLAAAGIWLVSCFAQRRQRERADYLLLNVVAAAVVPHLLKRVIDQERPDRQVHGRRRGIPKSGRPYDAFPSGHAVHIGNLASLIGRLYPRWRLFAWGVGVTVAGTRVLLLAHWLTDVLTGVALGVGLERLIGSVSPPQPRRRNKAGRIYAA